jgi:putative FmdB family regulatory protein
MSFIVFDYLCSNCDHFEESAFVRRSEMDNQDCPKCGALMKRLPAGPTTTFRFHDRSATKSKKAVSLRDPNYGASSKGHSKSLD